MRIARFRSLALSAVLVLLLPLHLTASSVTGRVINRTFNEPSPGDVVRLFEYGTTLHEEARAVTDARGIFQFERSKTTPFMISVLHQNVTYHSARFVTGEQVEVSVYDSLQLVDRAKVDRAKEEGEALFVEADTKSLKVTQFFIVSNLSDPPRTYVGASTFDFLLPNRATLDSVAVQPGGSLPSAMRPIKLAGNNHFGIRYPIRPGITKIVATYHLPHASKVPITARFLRPIGYFKVMLPASMQFASGMEDAFVQEGEENGIVTKIARNVHPGSRLSFSVSGIGDIHALSAAALKKARQARSSPPVAFTPASRLVPVNAQIPAQEHKLGANAFGKIIKFAIMLFLVLIALLVWRKPARLHKTS